MDENEKIADMNVEGMPWYEETVDETELQLRQMQGQMNRKETLRFMASAMLAALAVGMVFIVVIFFFLLFCTKIWFR